MDFKVRILKIYPETISDGIGLRYAIYFSGCHHECVGCHNMLSWDANKGEQVTYDRLNEIVDAVSSNKLLDGITLSGGDPFFYADDLLRIVQFLKKHTKHTIWCYTGYTYEELLENTCCKECLRFIDVLVDGKFEYTRFDPKLRFRGSSNQRILKLQNDSFHIEKEYT